MQSMRQALEPIGMLDQHQVAGIFVNWWDGVKYDLKTIMQRKWDIDLIYPEYSDLVTTILSLPCSLPMSNKPLTENRKM